VEQQQHTCQLEGEGLRHKRDTLATRLEEDYGISVAELSIALTGEEAAAREEVDSEIESLRRKIANVGAVNMDALADLTDLDARFQTLNAQYADLVDAKESLQRIITKINADSRRLFAETLEAIRENFGHLFRKVFGGGRADIVLEEDVDILDSGIDIIATPPGKQSLALSLLSGGERALTAVTLLLAIFQYRPSPFCVLDEVDGPLDEANIGRFIEVLHEFLRWTKFVVVTHSKRTMTAANTLYGITMQESGVSKRVAVRFEDVSEGGEISADAIHRSERSNATGGLGDDDERGAA
jgi:chromosome segregation protein